MTRLILILALVASGCAVKQPLPVGGDVIVKAKQAAIAIGTLQHSAIELNKIQKCDDATPPTCAPLLSDHNTGIVVDISTDVLKTMRRIPAGWRATADQGILQVEGRLDAAGKGQFNVYLEAARLVLRGIQ
jgi:hypothetical protein